MASNYRWASERHRSELAHCQTFLPIPRFHFPRELVFNPNRSVDPEYRTALCEFRPGSSFKLFPKHPRGSSIDITPDPLDRFELFLLKDGEKK